MTNPTIDGVEVAAQADLVALKAEVEALKAAPASVGPAGPAGPQGPKGDPGPAGKDGKDGIGAATTQAQIVAAVVAALGGTASAAGSASGAPAVDYFPTDPGLAPPSPEGSATLMENGKIGGHPYVVDKSSSVYSFAGPDGKPVPTGAGYYIFVNGVQQAAWEVTKVTIRNGLAWLAYNGAWFGVIQSPGVITRENAMPGVVDPNAPPPAPPAVLADPTPVSPAPGSSGNVVQVTTTLADAIASAKAGDTIKLDPTKTYNESVGVSKPLLLDGGGTVANVGQADASFSGGATLDGTSIVYVQGQGGDVELTDTIAKGIKFQKYGAAEGSTGGTAGLRNNTDGIFIADNCFFTGNQDGEGPHFGGPSLYKINNCLAVNNGIGDGLSHNFYFVGNRLEVDGLTSIVEANKGGGHAMKSRCLKNDFKNVYLYASDESSLDIPDGSPVPFTFSGRIVKRAGDANRVLISYGVENGSKNGTAGGQFSSTVVEIPADGQGYYILTSGPISFDAACKFVHPDGTPVKAGVIAASGGGVVTGLPA